MTFNHTDLKLMAQSERDKKKKKAFATEPNVSQPPGLKISGCDNPTISQINLKKKNGNREIHMGFLSSDAAVAGATGMGMECSAWAGSGCYITGRLLDTYLTCFLFF